MTAKKPTTRTTRTNAAKKPAPAAKKAGATKAANADATKASAPQPATNGERFTVALRNLKPDPRNVRRYESEAGIDELVALIVSVGLLQNLTVRAAEKAGQFYVTAGTRRLRALNEIAKRGFKIGPQQIPVTKDFPVAVFGLSEGHKATEVSLAENIGRLNMHEADQIEAFRKLVDDEGMTPEAVADRFGISHMTVRRRVKLARVSPKLLEELRKDKICLEQLQALALSEDHAAQEAAWFDARSESQRAPAELRARLSPDAVMASDHMARFVTVETYEQAGGHVLRDLFDEDETRVRLTDRELLHKLAVEKLEQEAEAVRGEGWKWVEPATNFNFYNGGYGRIYPTEKTLPSNDQRRVSAIDARLQEIELEIDAIEDESETNLYDEQEALENEREAILARHSGYDPEEMKTAGAFVTIGQSGAVKIERGVIKPEDVKAAKRASAATGDGKGQGEGGKAALAEALVMDLTATRTAALACELAKRPDIALAALVHRLALDAFYHQAWASSLNLSTAHVLRTTKTPDADNVKAFETLDALAAEWRGKLPKKEHELWQWCLDAANEELTAFLAYLVAMQIDAGKRAYADRVADAINFDMTAYWQPSQSFGNRVSKRVMADAVREAGREEWEAKNILDVQKADAVALFVEKLKDSRWLPGPLKTGPAPAAAIEADDEDIYEHGDEAAAFDQAAE